MAIDRTDITPVDESAPGAEDGTGFDAAWWDLVYDEIDAAIAGDIAATKLDDLAAPDDNTDLDASTSAHGLMAKITGSDGFVATKSGTGMVWAAASGGAAVQQTSSATGQQDNFNLTAKHTILYCTGAAPNFTGFTVAGATPSDGDSVVVYQASGTSAKVTHDASSTAANRIYADSANGQIVGVRGAISLVYNATAARWIQRGVQPGAWLDYTAVSTITGWSSFTSSRKFIFYRQVGRCLEVAWHLEGTSNSASTNFTLPFTSLTIGTAFEFAGYASLHYDNGSYPATTGKVACANNSNTVHCYMSYANGGWTASGTKIAEGQIKVEIP